MIMDTDTNLIDPATQIEVINRLSDKINTCYVFPEVAEQIYRHLQQTLAQGEYEGLTDGNLFALALTMQLQEVNHDEHLWVRWHEQALPDGESALRNEPAWQEMQRVNARAENYGFHQLGILPGNVGYLDIHYFHKTTWAGDTAVAAMQFLSEAGAVILDLRQCKGGYPATVALVCSYFFGEEPTLLTSIYWRDDDLTQQYWTLPYVPGRSLSDKPLFVLTSKITFSAGEMMALALQSYQRATLIGEKTDGGANPGTSFRIHPHFEAFIPIGCTIDLHTGASMDSTGIVPDIPATPENSFNLAYKLALQTILVKFEQSGGAINQAYKDEVKKALRAVEHTDESASIQGLIKSNQFSSANEL
jgi:hypothetical protein